MEETSHVQFPYAFYLLGAGTGAEYFWRLWLPIFFGAAPASVFFQAAPQTCEILSRTEYG